MKGPSHWMCFCRGLPHGIGQVGAERCDDILACPIGNKPVLRNKVPSCRAGRHMPVCRRRRAAAAKRKVWVHPLFGGVQAHPGGKLPHGLLTALLQTVWLPVVQSWSTLQAAHLSNRSVLFGFFRTGCSLVGRAKMSSQCAKHAAVACTFSVKGPLGKLTTS